MIKTDHPLCPCKDPLLSVQKCSLDFLRTENFYTLTSGSLKGESFLFFEGGVYLLLLLLEYFSLCPTAGSLQVMLHLSPPCQPILRRQKSSQLYRCRIHTQVRIHSGARVPGIYKPQPAFWPNTRYPPRELQQRTELMLLPLEL